LQQLLQVEQSEQPLLSQQLEQQVVEHELQDVLQEVSVEQQDAKAAGTRSNVTSQTLNIFLRTDFI